MTRAELSRYRWELVAEMNNKTKHCSIKVIQVVQTEICFGFGSGLHSRVSWEYIEFGNFAEITLRDLSWKKCKFSAFPSPGAKVCVICCRRCTCGCLWPGNSCYIKSRVMIAPLMFSHHHTVLLTTVVISQHRTWCGELKSLTFSTLSWTSRGALQTRWNISSAHTLYLTATSF